METCIRFFQILQSGTEIVGLRAFFVFGTGGNGKVPKNNQFNPFQPSVIFHIETVIWVALQIIADFYMEFYTGLK